MKEIIFKLRILIIALIGVSTHAQTVINVRNTYGWSATNNSSIIEAALTAQNNTGNTLLFDTGTGGAQATWKITQQWIKLNIQNITIVWADGTTLEAVDGSPFYGTDNSADGNESIWRMPGWRNVTIIGYGATFKMYQQANQTSNEYGHSIAIHGYYGANRNPENIVIKGLKLEGSGGDGIYALNCGGVNGLFVEDVEMTGHSRQAVSVITAPSPITFNRCIFNGTNKRPPMYGFDLEPNLADNAAGILNGKITFNNCTFSNNNGSGIGLEMFATTSIANNLNVEFNDCLLFNNSLAHPYATKWGEITTSQSDDTNPLGGNALYRRMAIDGSPQGAISHLAQGQAGGFLTTYKDFVGYNVSAAGQRDGIWVRKNGDVSVVGNIVFDGVLMKMQGNRHVLSYSETSGFTVRNVTGQITGLSTFNKWISIPANTTLNNVTATVEQNTSLPTTTVQVTATTPNAVKSNLQNGVFTFTRSSSKIDYPIFVRYSISAPSIKLRNEVGYLTGAVVIPKGATSATVNVVPRQNGQTQSNRDLTVTILARSGMYTIGGSNTATVTLRDTPPSGNTIPVITRLGSNPVEVLQGATYTDAGATASDAEDGNITANIVTVNPVNTAIVGTYTVTYNVVDSQGSAAVQVTRTVNVVPNPEVPQPTYRGKPIEILGTARIGGTNIGFFALGEQIEEPEPPEPSDPPEVSNVSVDLITSVSFRVEWDVTLGSKGRIYLKTGASGSTIEDYPLFTNIENNFLTFHRQTVPSLTPNTTYRWRIYTEDADGNSGLSEEFTTRTLSLIEERFGPNIAVWWDRSGIDASATADGNNVNTWISKDGLRTLNKVTGTQPTLELASGNKAVRFNSSAMSIAEWAGIDFTGLTDNYTIVVKLGNNVTASGSLVAKVQNGTSSMQYQLNAQNIATGTIGHNIGSTTANDRFASGVTATGTIVANKVISLAVGNANANDTQRWYDKATVALNTYTTASTSIGTAVNNHPLFIGARRNDSDTSLGFQFNGSIAHVLILNIKATQEDIDYIVDNIN